MSFITEQLPGRPGTVSTREEITPKDSYTAEGAIESGLLVVRGTDPVKQATLPTGATYLDGRNVAGIALLNERKESTLHADGSAVAVLRNGRAYVTVQTEVTAGGPVFVRVAAGNIGVFRHDADTANAVQVTGAVYVTSAGAGEVAEVELNLSSFAS